MSDEQETAADGTSSEVPSEDEAATPGGGEPAGGAADAPDTPDASDTLDAVDAPDAADAPDDQVTPQDAAQPPPKVSAGAGGAAAMLEGASIPEALQEAVGDGAERLIPLAQLAIEALAVALQRVSGQQAEMHEPSASVTDYAVIEEEFAGVDHAGFELRVALSEVEAQLAAVLVPMEDAGALLGIDTSAEQMSAEESAEAQLDAARSAARELLDLFSLTFFAAGPPGAEVVLSELRRGQADYTLGMVADVAQGAPPLRLDIGLLLPDGRESRITAVVPVVLVARLVELMSAPEQENSEAEAVPVAEAVSVASAAAAAEAGPAFPETPDYGVGALPPGLTAFPGVADAPGDGVAPGAGMDGGGEPALVHPVRFPPLDDGGVRAGMAGSLDLIMDVSVRVTVELGRSSMTVEEVLGLGPGSVVELNKMAGEPVDILVNQHLVARGEVVVVDENFGVRVTEIVSPRSRAHVMGS